MNPLRANVIRAWRAVASYIAVGHEKEFIGPSKENLVFHCLKKELERTSPGIFSTLEVRFNQWTIDLVCEARGEAVAIEGKFKTFRDGAVPDNRKEAFFDLHKLEAYVVSGKYSSGLFLWLTNNRSYLQPATGDSLDFSTHRGRVYVPGVSLNARRTRNRSLPLPLVLTRQYVFQWETIGKTEWHYLTLSVNNEHDSVKTSQQAV